MTEYREGAPDQDVAVAMPDAATGTEGKGPGETNRPVQAEAVGSKAPVDTRQAAAKDQPEQDAAEEKPAAVVGAAAMAAGVAKRPAQAAAAKDKAPAQARKAAAKAQPEQDAAEKKPAAAEGVAVKAAGVAKRPAQAAAAKGKAPAASAAANKAEKVAAHPQGPGAQRKGPIPPVQTLDPGSMARNKRSNFDIALIKSKPMRFARHLPFIGEVIDGKIKKREFFRAHWMSLLVILLITLFTCYFAFIATGMYVSESRFAVKGQKAMSVDNILSLLGGSSSDSAADRFIIAEYIMSPDMIFSLDKLLDLRAHYSHSGADFFSRLPDDASLDTFIKYWESVVSVNLDSASGVLTLKTKAFTSEVAHAINTEILRLSEQLINDMNNRALNDTLAQTKFEVKLAENRLAKARQALSSFRNQYQEIDPSATASSRVSLVTQLEGQLSATRVELETIRKFMSEDSHQVQALKGKMSGLEKQIDFEKDRIASSNNPELIHLLERFEELTIEHEFARQMYVSAISSLEAVRVKMENKSSYIEAFQKPTVPDEPTHPERVKAIIISIVVILLSYGIIMLLVAGVRDHMGV